MKDIIAKFAETTGDIAVRDYLEIVDILSHLNDPRAVHLNMLRGSIAKPSFIDFLHLYGSDFIKRWHDASAERWGYKATIQRKEKGEVLGSILLHRANKPEFYTMELYAEREVGRRLEATLPRAKVLDLIVYKDDATTLFVDGRAIPAKLSL